MKISVYASIIVLLVSCSQQSASTDTVQESKEQLSERITTLEKTLYDEKAGQLHVKEAEELIMAYHEYADVHSDKKEAAEYLFKAGEVSMGLQQFQKAISYFEKIRKDFPDSERSPDCLFIIAFIYDNHLDQKGKAKVLYEQMITNYPDHKFADDAKASIETLHMTDEELIEFFKKKEQETSDAEGH